MKSISFVFLSLMLFSCEEPQSTQTLIEEKEPIVLPTDSPVFIGGGERNEAYYRDQWASIHGGEIEVRLTDGTRCDIVTDDYAIEVEWAQKWYEGFGQSLWYGFQLNKKPAIVMILRSKEDQKYVYRIDSLAKHHKVDLKVWTVEGWSN